MKHSGDENDGLYGFRSNRVPISLVRPVPQHHIAERSIVSPPAAFIEDKYGNTFQLGYSVSEKRDSVNGHFCFEVLRSNAQGKVFRTGEFAAKIEMDKDGVVRIFGNFGKSKWKRWTGRSFI